MRGTQTAKEDTALPLFAGNVTDCAETIEKFEKQEMHTENLFGAVTECSRTRPTGKEQRKPRTSKLPLVSAPHKMQHQLQPREHGEDTCAGKDTTQAEVAGAGPPWPPAGTRRRREVCSPQTDLRIPLGSHQNCSGIF